MWKVVGGVSKGAPVVGSAQVMKDYLVGEKSGGVIKKKGLGTS